MFAIRAAPSSILSRSMWGHAQRCVYSADSRQRPVQFENTVSIGQNTQQILIAHKISYVVLTMYPVYTRCNCTRDALSAVEHFMPHCRLTIHIASFCVAHIYPRVASVLKHATRQLTRILGGDQPTIGAEMRKSHLSSDRIR